MPSDDLVALEKARRTLSDTIARMRPASPDEDALKDELVEARDGIAAEKDRLIEARFAGSLEGLDAACGDLETACGRLRKATDRIARTKKVIEIAGRILQLAAKAAAKLG